jgi:hypothetical protein
LISSFVSRAIVLDTPTDSSLCDSSYICFIGS